MNYMKQRQAFDKVYEILDYYLDDGETIEDVFVDELFDRASDRDQDRVLDLINPANWDY